jgi:hypothetical protein
MVWAQPSDTSLRSVDLRALAEKSSSLRKAILLKAFPMMPANCRPYIDDCMVKGCCHWRQRKGMGKYATPYFNREDLLKPKSLLILLNARARHEPSVFAHSDYDLAPLF